RQNSCRPMTTTWSPWLHKPRRGPSGSRRFLLGLLPRYLVTLERQRPVNFVDLATAKVPPLYPKSYIRLAQTVAWAQLDQSRIHLLPTRAIPGFESFEHFEVQPN